MKTKITTFILLFLSLLTYAQQTYVPDNNFEQALIDLGYDTVLDNYVTTANISGVTFLSVSSKNIADLTGIEDFTALTNLRCNNNQLTSLDVTQNTAITHLYCDTNELSSLDVTHNTALTLLDCSANQLTSLDVSPNIALTYVACSQNQLTSLNVKNGNNTNFTEFYADDNPDLTCIEVDDAAYSTTNWTNIDAQTSFSEDCSLAETYVPDDNFEQALIDLGYDTVLDDYVTTANISGVTSLSVASLNIADLTGIEDFTALTYLNCQMNQLTNLDVTQNIQLETLALKDNFITDLDVSQNTALTSFDCRINQLTSLDVSQNTALNYLDCYNNQLSNLDVDQNTALTVLSCGTNQISNLDVSQNSILVQLLCDDNQLTSLNVKNGNNSNVTTFYANNNPSLNCIEVDDAAYSAANWTFIDAQTSFSEDCSTLSVIDNTFNALTIYPNPASGIVNIKTQNTIVTLELYSILGKQLITVQSQDHIDVSGFQTGIYLLKIKTNEGSITKKIVIE